MHNNSTIQYTISEQKKGVVASLLLGIASLIIEVLFVGTENFYIYIGRYFLIFFPFAIICGVMGIKIGMKNLKLAETSPGIKILSGLGIGLSVLGVISASLFLVIGLYMVQFQ